MTDAKIVYFAAIYMPYMPWLYEIRCWLYKIMSNYMVKRSSSQNNAFNYCNDSPNVNFKNKTYQVFFKCSKKQQKK